MALQAPNASHVPPENYFLGGALLVPLVVVVLLLTQVPGTGLASSANTSRTDASAQLLSKRPAPSNAAPPPTLAPPAATSTPIPEPVAAAEPAAQPAGGYQVKPGDELKRIAAEHHVSLAQLIAANNIPDADSLRVGQVLRIPDR